MFRKGAFWSVVFFVWFFAVQDAVSASLNIVPTVSDGFSRIEFKWAYPTEYKISKSDGRLDLSFSRVIDADVSLIRRRLPVSVRSVTEGRDKKSLSILLTRPFVIRDFGTPTSLTVKGHLYKTASPSLRSRVTPGLSCTKAFLRPVRRLNKVDFPTFVRPTKEITAVII